MCILNTCRHLEAIQKFIFPCALRPEAWFEGSFNHKTRRSISLSPRPLDRFLALAILICLVSCQQPEPLHPVLATPTPTIITPEISPQVPITPIAIVTPTPSQQAGPLGGLNEAILLASPGIVAVDPLQGTWYELDRNSDSRMQFMSSPGGQPVSPDGQWLAYEVISDIKTVQREYTLVFLELLTGESMAYPVPPGIQRLFWLPDSQHIVFSVLENNSIVGLWLFDVFQGTHTVIQDPFPYQIAGVFPNGDYLYIADEMGREEEQVDLMRGSTTGSLPINLTSDMLQERQALLSPDGNKVAVIAIDPERNNTSVVCYCSGVESPDSAYILDLSSGERQEIALPLHTRLFDFSPDGSRLLYQDFGNCEACAGNQPICILDLATAQNQCIEQQGLLPTWSPDGEKLAFIWNHETKGVFPGVYDLTTRVPHIFYTNEHANHTTPHWVRLRPANEP